MYNHYHNQDIEFHITQFPPVPLCGQSLPLTLSLGDHRSVFCPHRIYFPEWHINGIILHTVFWDRLLLLTILHLRITHAGVSMSVRFSMHLIYDYERFTLILVIRSMQSLTSDQVFSCQVESQRGLWDFVWLLRTLVYWRPPPSSPSGTTPQLERHNCLGRALWLSLLTLLWVIIHTREWANEMRPL